MESDNRKLDLARQVDTTQSSLLTVAQVAEEAGVCTKTVLHWISDCKLRALDMNNGLKQANGLPKPRFLRVRRRDLEAFLRGCEVKESRSETKLRRVV